MIDFENVIIGAGVVGLAIARELSKRGSTLLIEKNKSFGEEVSSRNSEVIHSGIYYKENTKIKQEYNYLLNMSVYSFTLEKVDELSKEIENKKQDLSILQETEIKDMWIYELDEFVKVYKRRY